LTGKTDAMSEGVDLAASLESLPTLMPLPSAEPLAEHVELAHLTSPGRTVGVSHGIRLRHLRASERGACV
jgi:hypothetical protein